MTRYRMTLTPLVPLHVGTGEILSPTDYVIRAFGEGEDAYHVLYALDLSRLLASLSDAERADFCRAAEATDPVAVRRWLDARPHLAERFARWSVPVSPRLYGLYRQDLDETRTRGPRELAVHPMTRTGDRPYIPGSSIKGAVRTAVLQRLIEKDEGRAEALAAKYELESRRRRGSLRHKAACIEAEVLGYLAPGDRPDLRADPFRAVRVGDAPLRGPAGGDVTAVEPVFHHNIGPARTGGRRRSETGIQMFYEMTYSAFDDEDPAQQVRAEGALTIDDRLAATDARGAARWSFRRCVSRPLSAGFILEACRRFYTARLGEEADKVSRAVPEAGAAYAFLKREAGRLDPGAEALVRLGRFSHLECVTLGEPLRRARGGRSRTLAPGPDPSFLVPMGWAVLRLEKLDSA